MTQPATGELFDRLRGAVESYPQRLTEATREVARIGRTVVTGRSVDGMVEVEVEAAGDGTVLAVYLPTARWGVDSQTLAEDVAQAVNAAFDAVDGARDALLARLPDRRPEGVGSVAEELFQHRMDALAARIDGLEGRIGAAPGPGTGSGIGSGSEIRPGPGIGERITPSGAPSPDRLRPR